MGFHSSAAEIPWQCRAISMWMQSLRGTIKSNKRDGLHMQFMSFARGCMCALSGPLFSAISRGQRNGQRLPSRPATPAQSHSATLLKFFLANAFSFFCNLWSREVEMASHVVLLPVVHRWARVLCLNLGLILRNIAFVRLLWPQLRPNYAVWSNNVYARLAAGPGTRSRNY